MTASLGRTLKGSCPSIVVGGFLAAQDTPQTTKERITGASTSTTQTVRGTVVQVEGNTLVVKMASGDIREFNPPDSRKFIVDGQELSIHDLKPGTKLIAKMVTTQTSVIDRTTTVGQGKVWYVAPPNVILTLPNGENRQYKVKDDYKFIVGGKPATVFDLRKGMTVSAEKIVEVPHVEMATDTTVTGTAPKQIAAAALASTPAPAPAATPSPRPASKPRSSSGREGRTCPGNSGGGRTSRDPNAEEASEDG
jgi:hypothetical protein